MRRFFEFLFEIAKMVLISLAIILPIRYFLVQPFYVKGASMEPNFHEHEYLMVDEISYRFREVQRGDVVVFRYPKDPQEYFIKRVIGLPGETVTIKDGTVSVADQSGTAVTLKETYLPEYTQTIGSSEEPVKLQDDEYFVLGDNRNGSKDSRSFGPVNRSFLIGRVFFRGWPIEDLGLLHTPAYPTN